jgi:hypothetical protein
VAVTSTQLPELWVVALSDGVAALADDGVPADFELVESVEAVEPVAAVELVAVVDAALDTWLFTARPPAMASSPAALAAPTDRRVRRAGWGRGRRAAAAGGGVQPVERWESWGAFIEGSFRDPGSSSWN